MRKRSVLIGMAGLLVALTVAAAWGWELEPWGGERERHETRSDADETVSTQAVLGDLVAIAFSEAGMHCMNQDFSKLMILPPFNTFRAQVIDRSDEDPRIVQSGVSVNYSVVGNTTSANKTNFWTYAQQLFGFAVAPDVGLTGNRLKGQMRPRGDGRYEVTGIPITPIMDKGTLNPYPLGQVTVKTGTTVRAATKNVVAVSWEVSCNLCHGGPDGTDMAILRSHDALHGTSLATQTPVACGRCHNQPPMQSLLGSGIPTLSSLSRAMHGSHASRVFPIAGQTCYACHPGMRTQCQRDVHKSRGILCETCHGDMAAVAQPTRRPWVDEPRCGSCHARAGYEFEEPGKLFKESRGHNGVYCATCHGAPHAITPTVTKADNLQAIALQGEAGPLRECTICHNQTPDDEFNHTLHD